MSRILPFFVLFFSLTVLAQNLPIEQKRKLRYQRVGIALNAGVIKSLDHLGIDLSCGAQVKNDSIYIELDELSVDKLAAHHIAYNVQINDLELFYSQRAVADLPSARLALEKMKATNFNEEENVLKNVGQYNHCDEIDWSIPTNFHLNPQNSPNSFGGCLTYAQVMQELDEMRALYPNLISLKQDASPTNQTTVNGNSIYYVRISDNPDIDEPNEPETLYQSLIHSREAGSVMQLIYYMWYLLENYDNDESIQFLLNNQALYFIPVFNPDGFLYNEAQSPDGGGMQRKNRNGSNGCSTFLEGIDLNRNSAYYWGNGGSSTTPCNDTYMGASPFSESETQIMRDFFLQHDFKLALNHHSYKNAMLHAYAGTTIPNPRAAEYAKYSHDMSFFNRYAYGPSSSISYLNSGNMNDWMQGGIAGVSANGTATGVGSGKHTLAWTPENGNSSEGGFWPAPSNFVLIAKRAMRMNLLAAFYSGTYAKIHDLNLNAMNNLSDSLHFGIENLGQTPGTFTLTVNPITSNISTVGGPVIIAGMNILDQSKKAVHYTLSPTVQTGDTVTFEVILSNNYSKNNVIYKMNIKKVFQPVQVFTDNPDLDNLANWTEFDGAWYVSTDAYSGTQAISTTNNAPYAANQNKSLQLNSTFDLSGIDQTVIQFYAKWDLERQFDFVQFEASTDGVFWTPLCGSLTKPGGINSNSTYSNKSTNGFQPENEALYDGDMNGNWQQEEIVISQNENALFFNQAIVHFRFKMRTDNNNQQSSYTNAAFEGFSFDDFTIYNAIEISDPTGIQTVNLQNSSMFPNPFHDEIIIQTKGEEQITSVVIYQSNGQLIFEAYNLNASKKTLKTEAWSAGVYFVKINNEAMRKVVKF